MLTPLAAMVRKDLQLFFSDRRSVIVSFFVPIAIASFFGSIFSGPSRDGEPARIAVMGDPNEVPTFDTTVQWDFLPQVIDVAVGRLPALESASISHAWAGLYEMTPDGNPIIGPAGVEGFYTIAGFSGHGFQHSPAAGRILADVIGGHDPHFDLSPFALERFSGARPGGERYVI